MLSDRKITFVFVALLMCITALLYYPGLNSGFYLDDYPNLDPLKHVQEDDVAGFSLNGHSSRLGRPISLWTFFLQKDSYPNTPSAIKAVNLTIHITNGLLVFYICLLLAKLTDTPRKEQFLFAGIVSCLWLISPIQTTTVLYAIQRMAQLSTLFVFLGILAYLYIRRLSINPYKKVALLTTTTYLTMGLGILCKESAILLPGYILITELLFFKNKDNKHLRRAIIFILSMPLIAFTIYMTTKIGSFLDGYSVRNFTFEERIITQFDVLKDYLAGIILPRPNTYSIFHDTYEISRNLFYPKATYLSVLIIISLIALAILVRKHVPILSLGIFLYFFGHSLESSFIPLELYFEHRNYAPSLGIFIGLTWTMIHIARSVHLRKLALFSICIYILLTASITFHEVRDWGDPILLAEKWHKQSLNSARTTDLLAATYLSQGYYENAEILYKKLEEIHPTDIYPIMTSIRINACVKKAPLSEKQWARLMDAAHTMPVNIAVSREFNVLDDLIREGECGPLDVNKFLLFAKTLIKRNIDKPFGNHLIEHLANLYITAGDLESAIIVSHLAYKKTGNITSLFRILAILHAQKKMDLANSLFRDVANLIKEDQIKMAKYRATLEVWRKKLSKE